MNFLLNCEKKISYLFSSSLVLLLFVLVQSPSFAGEATPIFADPVLQNHFPSGISGLAFEVKQHPNGIIFAAHRDGLSYFDGERWTLVADYATEIRSFTFQDKRIYFGSIGQIGYFELDKNGFYQTHFLTEQLPQDKRNFRNINNIHNQNNRIIFTSENQVMIYSQGKLQVLDKLDHYNRSWKVNGEIYISSNPDLYLLKGTTLEKVEGLKQYSINRVSFVVDYEGTKLIGTANHGIFEIKNKQITPWLANNADIADAWVYDAKALSSGYLAVNTIHSGILFYNQNAQLVYHIDQSRGLAINTVLDLYEDNQHNLWLAQEGQVSQMLNPFGLTLFDSNFRNLPNISNLTELDNQLYVSSSNGIKRIDTDGPKTLKEGLGNSTSLASYQNGLLVADMGCPFLDVVKHHRLEIDHSLRCIDVLVNQQEALLVTNDGLISMSRKDNKWNVSDLIINDANISSGLVVDQDGDIWTGNPHGEFYQLYKKDQQWMYHTYQPLETGNEAQPIIISGKIYLSADQGLFKWNKTAHKIADAWPPFQTTFPGQAGPGYAYDDRQGHIWMSTQESDGYFERQVNNSWVWKSYPIKMAGMNLLKTVYQRGKEYWIGFDNGLMRLDYDHLQLPSLGNAGVALIKYRQSGEKVQSFVMNKQQSDVSIGASKGTIRLHFYLSDYSTGKRAQFRYQIDGNGWGLWSNENYADIANWGRGAHQIQIESKDIYGRIIEAKPLKIHVTPLWYLNNLALTILALLALLLIGLASFIFVKARTKALLVEQERLEKIVEQRTLTVTQQAEELKELNEAKSRFFANVSHEFRTPLTLTMGPLQDLLREEKNLSQKANTYIQMALTNSQRMLELLGQVLDIGRLESKRMQLRVQQYDIADTLRVIYSRFKALAEKQGILMTLKGTSNPVMLYFDADQIDKMISNLLSNAIKFTPKRGQIECELDQQNRFIILRVSDTGSGISEQDQKHIFERYYQSAQNQNPEMPGTGIGLALVKELIELHHGQVKLKSTLGEGSCFELKLLKGNAHFNTDEILVDSEFEHKVIQKSEMQTELTPLQSTANDKTTSENSKILLVVDDNQELREFIRLRLNSLYRIEEAINGQQALQKIQQGILPDIIVSDVMMPVMNGHELTEQLKSNPETAHIPLILLSAKSSKRETVEGLMIGADDYLSKPFDTSELAARVHAQLARKQQIAEHLRTQINQQNPEDLPHTQNEFTRQLAQLNQEALVRSNYSVQDLAKDLHVDRTTLLRKMKKNLNMTPSQYIRETRLAIAKQLLIDSKGSVSEVAYTVGYESLSHFSRNFKEHFGCSPSQVQ
ncbi:MAG: ATP-binding protein [bacterium]